MIQDTESLIKDNKTLVFTNSSPTESNIANKHDTFSIAIRI